MPLLPVWRLALNQQEDQQEGFEEGSAPELWIFEILFDLTLAFEMLQEDLDELRERAVQRGDLLKANLDILNGDLNLSSSPSEVFQELFL